MYILKTYIGAYQHQYCTNGKLMPVNCSGCDCESPCEPKLFRTIESAASMKYHLELEGAFVLNTKDGSLQPLY
jgi:hypothetical protein